MTHLIALSHLGKIPSGFRSFVPETGMKNKYTFFIINHTITSCLIKMIIIKKAKNNKYWSGCRERPFSCAIARNLSWRSLQQHGDSSKIKNTTT